MSNSFEVLKGILQQQYALYPQMQLVDVVKLIYQSEFAGGHLISDEAAALARLQNEWNAVKPDANIPVFEVLSDGICRLNLAPIIASGITPSTVNRLFVLSANAHQGELANFERKLTALRQWCQSGQLAFDVVELDSYLADYRERGYPPVSHSEVYRAAYAPAYRVLQATYQPYFELLSRLDSLLAKTVPLNVAIDGCSGSGKTSLAAVLQRIYDSNVIHMDHFFLPFPLRTAARLAEPGGNIDYERFSAEVLPGLIGGEEFSYGVFDCGAGEIVRQVRLPRKQMNIIEGVYSLHPKFSDSYHLSILLQVDKETQSRRVLQRSGPALHQRFLQEWIPMEDNYFTSYRIAERADFILSL